MFNTFKKCCGAFIAVAALLVSTGVSFGQCAEGENEALLIVGGGTWDGEINWIITDADGVQWTGSANDPAGEYLCGFAEGTFSFWGYDSFGDGWNGASAVMTWNGIEVMNWSGPSSALGPNEGEEFIGSANFAVPGCMDDTACNFNPDATEDDESCCFGVCVSIELIDSWGDGWNGGMLYITDSAGEELVSTTLEAGAYSYTSYCLDADPGCYLVTVEEGGWAYENSWVIYDGTGAELLSGLNPFGPSPISLGGADLCVFGCDDDMACNYDAEVNFNDGSCDYSCVGCMDPTAANFDGDATMEGDCVYCEAGTYVMGIDMTDSAGDGWNGASYYFTSLETFEVVSGDFDNAQSSLGDIATDLNCVALGCYTFTVAGGSAVGEVGYTLFDQFGTVYVSGSGALEGYPIDLGMTASCDFEGCTDSYCHNYNPSVTIDDGSCICPPPNNAIENAEAVTCGSEVSGNMENATDPDDVVDVVVTNIAITTPGIWYAFNAASDQQIFVSTCGTTDAGFAEPITDTKIHVFRVEADGSLTGVVGNDDACGFLSTAAFVGETGNDYLIHVSRFSLFTGGNEILLTLTCEECENGVPSNDFCETALPQVSGVVFEGTTCCASPPLIPSFSGSAFATNYAVWFTFNSSDYDTFDFSVINGSGANVSLTIYTAGGSCDDLDAFVGCVVTGQCAGSIESFVSLTPDTDYYFAVGTTDPENCGDFEFVTTGIYLGCTDPSADNYDPQATQDDASCEYTTAPANDSCDYAVDLPCGETLAGSTGGADFAGYPIAPGCSPIVDAGVWYTFAGTGQLHTLSTCGSVVDTHVQVFTADDCDGPFTCVEDNAGSFEGCGFFDQDDSFMTFISDAAYTYYVYVSTDDDGNQFTQDEGSFEITLTCVDVVEGCMISEACNYVPDANVDDGSCDYFSCVCDENPDGTPIMIEMFDSFGDGWTGSNSGSPGGYQIFDNLGALVYEGYIDIAFYQEDNDNFDGPEYGFDALCLSDGCYSYVFTGADIWAGEMSWSVSDADGVLFSGAPAGNAAVEQIDFVIGAAICGCTDEGACNYDAAATDENGTCEYETCAGCMDGEACNFDVTASIADDSCCYDNCLEITMNDSFGDGWQGCVITVTTLSGDLVLETGLSNGGFPDNNFAFELYCLPAGCYVVSTSNDSFAGEVSWTLGGIFGGALSGGVNFPPTYFSLGGNNCIEGCSIACACNYDEAATILVMDDCEFDGCEGCTYAEATNYDPAAAADDGTCVFDLSNPCPADLNQDGYVTTGDLLEFLAAFGVDCEE